MWSVHRSIDWLPYFHTISMSTPGSCVPISHFVVVYIYICIPLLPWFLIMPMFSCIWICPPATHCTATVTYHCCLYYLVVNTLNAIYRYIYTTNVLTLLCIYTHAYWFGTSFHHMSIYTHSCMSCPHCLGPSRCGITFLWLKGSALLVELLEKDI